VVKGQKLEAEAPCEEVKKVQILWALVEEESWAEVLDLRVQIQAEVLETIWKDRKHGFAVASLSVERLKEGWMDAEEWGKHDLWLSGHI